MEIKLKKVSFYYKKKHLILLLMRTFIFLLCTSVFSITPSNVISQNSKIKIDSDKVLTVDEVFELIMQQTDYNFIYEDEIFKNYPKVSLKKGVIRTSKLLQKSLGNGNLNVILTSGNTILIKDFVPTKRQQLSVSGKITDEAGLPMAGVVVLIKGTTNGVASNFDGTYSITVPNPENVLVFSFLGFETQEITVGNQSSIDVVLKEDVENLNEVVVTGYQTISKERSAGSFAKPEMKTLSDRTTSMNILQRLDGLVPGLVINNSPNSTVVNNIDGGILIRGLSTINGNPNPLFVVDGVVLSDVSSINPQDVEDITVLKDATAASIWGARAANGVIVITTKRGGFNKKIQVDYDTFINFQGKPDLNYRPVLSSEQFIQTAREIFDPVAYDYSVQSIYSSNKTQSISVHNQILYDLDNGVINQTTADAMLNSLANTNNLNQIEDLFYRNATVNNHTLSVQGGGEKHAFYGSMAYTNTQDNQPGSRNDSYKLNLRQDFKVNNRINFRLNTDLTNTVIASKRNISPDNRFTPYALFRDENGNNLALNSTQYFSRDQLVDLENASGINLGFVPLDEVNKGYTDFNNLSARITAGIDITLFKGLKYQGTYGYFHQNGKGESFDNEDSYRVRADRVFFTVPGANPGDDPTYNLPEQGGYYRTTNNFNKNWTFRNQLNYNQSFNEGLHRVTALLGYESQDQFFSGRQTFTIGYDPRTQLAIPVNNQTLASGISGTLVSNFGSRSRITIVPLTESETQFRFTSLYANGSYTFNNKYTISGSFRSDESSLFGVDKSAQNRPVWSAGLKWNIGKEPFMGNVNWIDNLALRGTYGITGNSPAPGGAASFDVLRTQNASFLFTSAPLANRILSPGNEKLTWERTDNLNLGLDFTLFNNRLRGSFDYYKNKTVDLLDRILTNSFTGYTEIPGNSGDLENKGIELSLQSLNIDGDFRWTTGLILGYNKNEITSLNSSSITPPSADSQINNTFPQVGYSAFPLFAYDFVGLNNEGSPEIRLSDGSIISEFEDIEFEDLIYMGSYQPKWSGGFSNSFSAKGFTLTANMVYNLGHVMFIDTPDRYSGLILDGGRNNFTSGNVHADFVNRWKQPGDETTTNIPAYTPLSTTLNRNPSYYKYGAINVASASYVKLRDVSLSYTLPNDILEKINASNITFRLMLNNVMLWKENDKGIDPEFHNAPQGARSTPINQNSITFGMHLTF